MKLFEVKERDIKVKFFTYFTVLTINLYKN
jgi:hypothetical protein